VVTVKRLCRDVVVTYLDVDGQHFTLLALGKEGPKQSSPETWRR